MMDEKDRKPLLGMTPDEMRDEVTSLGMPAFTARQIAEWIYRKGVEDIGEMTNISKKNRELLAQRFVTGRSKAIAAQTSADGTRKYLFPAGIGNTTVEAVYIPDGERATLCVSCQVGCKMNCLFCQTGKQGFEGQLTAAAILNQVYSLPERGKLTNVVFMGQGEPMDNLDNVLRATETLTAAYGWAWSPKRITVSTVGVRGKLKRFLDESRCHLAISLHSPFHEQRLRLMPAERAMPIEDTVALLRQYDFSGQRRLSFEYIVLGGENDTTEHARAVVRLLSGMECRVNLIRFHQIPGVPLHGASDGRIEEMRDYLTAHGIFTTIRASRGQDILAACGLLNTKYKDRQGEEAHGRREQQE